MKSNIEKGNAGEIIACQYIKRKGYKILKTNYSTAVGEIDIIAADNQYIVFIEVKYRNNITKGYPREAVGKSKQNKIKKTALYYIVENDLNNNDFRFDVIEILGNNIEHIENAFW